MKTKIIATVGPASSSREMLKALIEAGVSVFRLNFSHGSHSDHLSVIENVRSLNKELGTYIALLGDLQGPKIRIGKIEGKEIHLTEGQIITFTTREGMCTPDHMYISYPDFARDVKAGEFIQLDDGKLMLKIESTNGTDEVKTSVVHGGILTSNKGVNLPDTDVSLPSLTEKDLADLRFILENQLNWVALSFVRKADDIRLLKKTIRDMGFTENIPAIIAKMEKPEAVRNMDEIIEESDALMVARGDLGVELPLEQVPIVQKQLINSCNKASKQIIVATQMMEGMISNIRPTRAEVNDVANSVLDGADAVMLSGETSVGMFPVEVVRTMRKIIGEVEKVPLLYNKFHMPNTRAFERIVSDSILNAAITLAHDSKAKAIIALSRTGYSAARLSSQRPEQDLIIVSDNEFLITKLSLLWGVKGLYFNKIGTSTSKTLKGITENLVEKGKLNKGDLVLHVTSTPIYVSGKTNSLKLEFI